MADETNNSLINLGDISKPADTLIKKVSKAVGGIFEPYQIKRIAKAEAEAAVIKVQAEIQITELHRRAMHRFIEEEATKQKNIEDITNKAIPLLEEKTDAEKMNDDWVTNFFDKSRIVSDKEMQGLWASVLAGEANAPGTYSKRTVNYLGDLDRADADLFTKLCSFGWMVGNVVPLIFDVQKSIYTDNGINFNALSHLESIGLIQFENLSGFRRLGLPKKFYVVYYGQPLMLEMPNDEGNELELGHVLLTKVGQELAPICGSKPVDGFFDYVKEQWKAHIPTPVTEQGAPGDAPHAARP
ncbi:DUF2806 domain-containing protein [Ottowia sp.]|uniref:DUF2806 domain-containing protein n=1 Tax=Ottowia sp. TaxID=1898956 RepID=UPI0025CDCC03|nr:DUF2806 domain-containing protein [Ottowia sp.]